VAVLTLEYPDLLSVKAEIQRNVKAYVFSIKLLGSLKEYLGKKLGLKVYVEGKLDKKEGGFKKPDLLIHSENYVIVDHKYTESQDERTLTSKIKEMEEYDTIFILFEEEIRPEIVMLTPKEAAEIFSTMSNAPTTWGYVLNKEIKITQDVGKVRDKNLLSLFRPMFVCPIESAVLKYRFITSYAPLPYTAWNVYNVLWTLKPANLFFVPEFEIDYKILLDQFNKLFPPWISKEVRQLTESRLQKSLIFLAKIGWVKWVKEAGKIIIDVSKGKNIPDLLPRLIQFYAEIELKRLEEEYTKRLLELQMKEKERTMQTKISDFLGS